MKLTNAIWVRPLAWSAVAVLVVAAWVRVQHVERDEMERINPWLRLIRWREEGGRGQPPQMPEPQTPPDNGMTFIVMSNDFPKVHY